MKSKRADIVAKDYNREACFLVSVGEKDSAFWVIIWDKAVYISYRANALGKFMILNTLLAPRGK